MGGAVSPGMKGAIKRTDTLMRELRPNVAKLLAPKIDRRYRVGVFVEQRDIYGKPMAPLAETTLRRKRNTPGGSIILSRTFDLAQQTYALYTGKRVVITIGESGQYAHEGDTGRGKRPPRRLLFSLGLPKNIKNDIEESTQEALKAAKI